MIYHTSGPWELVVVHPQEISIDAPNGDADLEYTSWESLAVVYGSDEFPTIGEQKALANAKLIAAAPDMLRVLEDIEWLTEDSLRWKVADREQVRGWILSVLKKIARGAK